MNDLVNNPWFWVGVYFLALFVVVRVLACLRGED